MTKSIDEVFVTIPKIFFVTLILLFIAHLGVTVLYYGFSYDNILGIRPLVNFDGEMNIPAWFSTLILFHSSLLLYIIHNISDKNQYKRFWFILSIVFSYLSLDEFVGLHEKLVSPINSIFNFDGYFLFSWIFVGLAFVIAVGLYSIPFLLKLPRLTAIHFISAGSIFVIGAVGFEMLGGNEFDLGVKAGGTDYDQLGIKYAIFMTIEETMEMSGIILFNYALVRYLSFIVKNKEAY